MRSYKILALVTALVLIMTLLCSCGVQTSDTVKISVRDYGDIIIQLRPDVAPITVENFKKLVSRGFYNGLTFHRVVKDFMIQGGDPQGTGLGSSDEKIKGEFSANGVNNTLSHTKGVISMARGSYNLDSASCQFFITNTDATGLDGQYAAFGVVIEGIEVVDAISDISITQNPVTGEYSYPTTPVVIESITFVY